MNCQACKDLKWILFILAWNHLVAVRFLSTVFTVSAQRVNIVAEFDEQPVQFMIRGDLKNVECIIPLIHHMYRSFLRVVHLKSLLIFGSRLKRRVPFSLGLITQTSVKYSLTMFYPYLHLTKKSFLTFIKQPCCFIRWPTFLQPRHQPKTGPQRSAPIARSWIRWGDLSSKISR